MTKAREIITTALTIHLNRLAPGETLNDDDAAKCLLALNNIADSWNGSKSFLFREVLTQSTPITGSSAALGVTWPGLSSGDEILGATYQYTAGMDFPLDKITLEQYSVIAQKATASLPRSFAHDGAATVYFYPACTGQTVTLRTKQVISDFADLDTDYVMPKGYKSALSACLAEAVAPVMGGLTPSVVQAAKAARKQVQSQAINPAIIGGAARRGNILAGW